MNTAKISVWVLCFVLATHAHAQNQVSKVFHHRGVQAAALELGNVVVYFTATSQVHEQSSSDTNHHRQVTFTFPNTALSANAQAMINALAQHDSNLYSVRFTAVGNERVTMTVSFDPRKIQLEYEEFESISMKKGLVFRFFDKELLSRISGQNAAILQTVSLQRPRVIVDCGHGGKDSGAIGCFSVCEKDVTMNIGVRVAQLLRAQGIDAVLTRDGDQTIALDERTSFANTHNAHMLVSIHANAAPQSEKISGIETFCLNDALFTSKNKLGNQWDKTMMHQRYAQSHRLAQTLHANTVKAAQQHHTHVVDRRVKHSVAQVLVGSSMPSALIEVGFLSNPHEAKLLQSHLYQSALAYGICTGIISYIKNA